MNLDKPKQVQLSDAQRKQLNNTKQAAATKINQGTDFIDSNLLNKFKNLKNINKIEGQTILDTFKNVISEIFDYFMEYLPEFSIKIGVMLIIVIVYFSMGGAMLYICKISQTNFLPVFSNCFPYSDANVKLNDITTNIFTQTINEEQISMNLKFKFEDNNKNVILDAIRNYTTSNKANNIIVYLLSIVNALFSYNYNCINTIFGNLNGLNDLLIIILSPIIYIICFIFLFVSNNVYFIFLWFYKMSWFFKINKNCNKSKGKANWAPIELMYNPVQYLSGMLLTSVACVLSIGLGISLLINPFLSLPSMTILYSMISSIIMKGEIKDNPVNIFTIILNVLKYYKLPMFVMLSFFTIFRSNISEKVFNIYENYNLKKTSILGNFGENLMKINKDVNKMNNLSNKIDVLNVRDRVDVIGIDNMMDENSRKLQNQINSLNEKNRKLTNTQNTIADKLEDAYNVNTPFTVVILCIIFAILSSLGSFKISDYKLFSKVASFETNDVECGGEDAEIDGDHTAIYKSYMVGKSLWNTYQNTMEKRKKSLKNTIDPVSKTNLDAIKKQSLGNFNDIKKNTNDSLINNTNTTSNEITSPTTNTTSNEITPPTTNTTSNEITPPTTNTTSNSKTAQKTKQNKANK
jgi:hypothetical protein